MVYETLSVSHAFTNMFFNLITINRKNWSSLSRTKKGLIIGLCIGILFGIYSITTSCHASFGGSSGCANQFQLLVAAIEFLLLLPFVLLTVLLFRWNPGPGYSLGFKISTFISIVLVFAIIGLLVGFIAGKVRNSSSQR